MTPVQAGAIPVPDIDAVVTWVDGDDPVHRAKLNRLLESLGRTPSAAAPTRFRSVGEIDYCITSLLKFAPFLRRIHVITDAQTPPIFERSRAWPQAARDKLVLVDHREVFRGHEDCLPTFNSLSIETVICRVPGLAEHFVYFNDDVMLIKPVRAEDWFRNGQPVVRGIWKPLPERLVVRRLLRGLRDRLRRLAGIPPRAGHGDMQTHAARLAGSRERFLELGHHPHPLRRSTFENFFATHPQALRSNVEHRLRSSGQFLPQGLASHLEIAAGTAQVEHDGRVFYLKPSRLTASRLKTALSAAEQDSRKLSACVQSLDEADPAIQRQVTDWFDRVIGRLEFDR
jgi:hypothetical protein